MDVQHFEGTILCSVCNSFFCFCQFSIGLHKFMDNLTYKDPTTEWKQAVRQDRVLGSSLLCPVCSEYFCFCFFTETEKIRNHIEYIKFLNLLDDLKCKEPMPNS